MTASASSVDFSGMKRRDSMRGFISPEFSFESGSWTQVWRKVRCGILFVLGEDI